jgi:hypothetical protein
MRTSRRPGGAAGGGGGRRSRGAGRGWAHDVRANRRPEAQRSRRRTADRLSSRDGCPHIGTDRSANRNWPRILDRCPGSGGSLPADPGDRRPAVAGKQSLTNAESAPAARSRIGSAPDRVSPERVQEISGHPPNGSATPPFTTHYSSVNTQRNHPFTQRDHALPRPGKLFSEPCLGPDVTEYHSALPGVRIGVDQSPMIRDPARRHDRHHSGGPLRPSVPEILAPALIPAGPPSRNTGDGERSGRRNRCMRWPRSGSRRRGCV